MYSTWSIDNEKINLKMHYFYCQIKSSVLSYIALIEKPTSLIAFPLNDVTDLSVYSSQQCLTI